MNNMYIAVWRQNEDGHQFSMPWNNPLEELMSTEPKYWPDEIIKMSIAPSGSNMVTLLDIPKIKLELE